MYKENHPKNPFKVHMCNIQVKSHPITYTSAPLKSSQSLGIFLLYSFILLSEKFVITNNRPCELNMEFGFNPHTEKRASYLPRQDIYVIIASSGSTSQFSYGGTQLRNQEIVCRNSLYANLHCSFHLMRHLVNLPSSLEGTPLTVKFTRC